MFYEALFVKSSNLNLKEEEGMKNEATTFIESCSPETQRQIALMNNLLHAKDAVKPRVAQNLGIEIISSDNKDGQRTQKK